MPNDDRLTSGTRVEVRDRLDFSFCTGFEIAATTPDGYRVRRLSDGAELPALFSADDVRPDPPPRFRP
jgi:hypothetical protein